jgi:hypothetical protein
MKWWLILVSLCSFTSAEIHKFYFSETLLEYKNSSQVQITCKVFHDDWAKATGTENVNENTKLDSLYFKYFKEHFTIQKQDDQLITLQWVGYEKDGEFLYLYTECNHLDSLSITVHQQVLMELYEDQKNLVNYRKNGTTKSLYFFRDSPPQTIHWP